MEEETKRDIEKRIDELNAQRDVINGKLEELSRILHREDKIPGGTGRICPEELEDGWVLPKRAYHKKEEKRPYHHSSNKRKYGPEMIKWLKKNCKGKDLKELTKEFNKEFHLKVDKQIIKYLFRSRKELDGHKYETRDYIKRNEKGEAIGKAKCAECQDRKATAWVIGKHVCQECYKELKKDIQIKETVVDGGDYEEDDESEEDND
jgi:hypothetical protein